MSEGLEACDSLKAQFASVLRFCRQQAPAQDLFRGRWLLRKSNLSASLLGAHAAKRSTRGLGRNCRNAARREDCIQGVDGMEQWCDTVTLVWADDTEFRVSGPNTDMKQGVSVPYEGNLV